MIAAAAFFFLGVIFLVLRSGPSRRPGAIAAGKARTAGLKGQDGGAGKTPGEGVFRFSSVRNGSRAGRNGKAGDGARPGEKPRRPGQEIGDRRFEKALDMLDEKRYGDALEMFNSLASQYPDGSFEAMAVAFNIAETHFFNKSMGSAKNAYAKFLEKYPNSPFADNARAALDFIGSFDKYQAMYVSPDEIGEGGKR